MKKYLLLIATSTVFASCSKWLDVTPKSDVSETSLFNTEDGFKDALNGLYSRCIQHDLYGRDLSVGTLDVLAQNYNIAFNDGLGYLQTSLFNYENESFINRKDQYWNGLYNVIANSNQILNKVDEKRSLMTDMSYGMFKGEALAMRAYCHFDLLRMFAPSFVTGANQDGIPYLTTFSKDITPQSTVTEDLDFIIKDLKEAKDLLKTIDPILTAAYVVGYPDGDSTTETEGRDLFIQNRRHRLNYYAVCAELARVYLYKGEYQLALDEAEEVIHSNKFPFTKQTDFMNPNEELRDRINYNELVFAFYAASSSNTLNDQFRRSPSQSLTISTTNGRSLYEVAGVGAEDFRFKQWFSEQAENTGTYLRLEKYKRDPDANLHPQVIPGIRLSEVYYIAAECIFDKDPGKAWEYFNTVRKYRGIGQELSDPDKTFFMKELVKEARKEMYGEGQIFYMYKRLNIPLQSPTGSTFPVNNNIFVFPMPDDEISFGNR